MSKALQKIYDELSTLELRVTRLHGTTEELTRSNEVLRRRLALAYRHLLDPRFASDDAIDQLKMDLRWNGEDPDDVWIP